MPALDGLRAASILPVVFHHATPRPLEGALGRGPLGVDLFFALSGFLITSLLLDERRRTKTVHLKAFYARRSLRLMPLYYLVLGLYAAYAGLVLAPSPVRDYFFRTLPFYVTYTQNWFSRDADHPVLFLFSWSLATEEQFYALWAPALRWLHGTVAPAALMVALIAADQLVEQGVILEGAPQAARIVKSFATPIGLGCLVALAADHDVLGPRVRWFLERPATKWLTQAGAVAAFAVGIPLVLAHVIFALLVGAAALDDGRSIAFAWARRPAVAWVGRVSYGIYLLHVSVIAVVHRVFPAMRESAFFVFALSFPASIAVATGTFWLVERPIARLRERFRF